MIKIVNILIKKQIYFNQKVKNIINIYENGNKKWLKKLKKMIKNC